MAGDRQLVREAVAAYFGGTRQVADGGIYYQSGPLSGAGLGTAFPYKIKKGAPDKFYTLGVPSGFGWGAVLSVSLGSQHITRRPDGSTGGPVSGWRARHYTTVCGLDVISWEAHLEQAEAGLDDLIDGLLGLIYADRTLGTTSTQYPTGRLITQAGEGAPGIVIGPAEWSVEADRGIGKGGLEITFDCLTMVEA